MNAVYFETYFRTEESVNDWPGEFAIITAYATTGENWSAERNEQQDAKLETNIARFWHRRIKGFHPNSGHAEPGWAVELGFQDACRLGDEFLQEAIYFVSNGLLAVSECQDGRRQMLPVGKLEERVTVEG